MIEAKKQLQTEGEDSDDEEEEEKPEIKPYEIIPFDPADSIFRFDEENPKIEIPAEVMDDIDNDIELKEEDLKPEQD